MKKQVVTIALRVVAVGLLVGGVALGGVLSQIRQSVQNNCRLAQQAHPHPGDDVAALVEYMNSAEHSLYDRNHKAVWTLGRLRDQSALPALQLVYTGESCDHDEALCQYELEKAIKLCGGAPAPSREAAH